jgi:hypothetical protein
VRDRVVLAALAAACIAAPASAQFASDYPGVPRAAISISGSTQARNSWAFTGYRIPGGTAGDTTGGGLRVAIGRSYRVRSEFEVSWDFTLLDGTIMQTPRSALLPTTPASTDKNSLYMRGMTAYGIRFGGKWRPVVSVDPNGNGYELAIGGGFQPQLKPLYGYEKLDDSTRSGGQFQTTNATPSAAFRQNPFAGLSATTIIAAMGSYRSKRLSGDAALVMEKSPDPSAGADPSPLTRYNGTALKAGGAYRLSPGFAVGATYWGSGSPPWWDEVAIGMPRASKKPAQFGLLLQFGSDPESGIDMMYAAPNGNYGQSGRLYIRARSTR